MKLLAPGIIVVPAVVHAMIVSIDSTLSGQQSIYYYGSNPRRFIWLLPPQNYAGLAADTAFQINLSVSVCCITSYTADCIIYYKPLKPSNISTNQSMFMAIYTAAQQVLIVPFTDKAIKYQV